MRKLTATLAAVGVSAVMVLSGCSAGGGGNAGGADGAPALKAINDKPRDELKDGGKVRFAISQLPTNWNHLSAEGNGVDNQAIFEYVGAVLFRTDEHAKKIMNKDYLKDAKVTDAKDGKPQVVTLTFSDKAKWNSGRPFDWEDVAGMWKAMNGSNEAFKPATTDGFDQVVNVEQGETPQVAKITYKSSYPDWWGTWSNLVPKELTATPESFASLKQPKNEWLAGPFIFKNINASERVATLERNPKWWGDKAKLDEVSFRELDAKAEGQAFANNEVDILPIIIDANTYQQAVKRSDGELRTAGSLQWRHVTFNSKSGNLQDVKVRQAIQRGINREAIAKSDLAGLPVDPAKLMLGNHFFMPGQEGYQDNSKKWSYDPKAAGKLLDEAGWKMDEAKKVRMKDGKPLEVEYQMLTGVPTSENEGKLIQSDLSKIGVTVKVVNKSPDEFPGYLLSGQFGMTTFTWQGTALPMANIGQIYGSGQSGNYAKLDNPEIDKLREKADVEMDEKKRMELANKADELIWEEVHTLPLYRRQDFTAVPKNLANFGAFGLSSVVPQDIGYVK